MVSLLQSRALMWKVWKNRLSAVKRMSSLPRRSIVVAFLGLPYRILYMNPKRNYYGAPGYMLVKSGKHRDRSLMLLDLDFLPPSDEEF